MAAAVAQQTGKVLGDKLTSLRELSGRLAAMIEAFQEK